MVHRCIAANHLVYLINLPCISILEKPFDDSDAHVTDYDGGENEDYEDDDSEEEEIYNSDEDEGDDYYDEDYPYDGEDENGRFRGKSH